MSDSIGKCPEMIGYVGDVQNLSENRGVAVSKKKIIQWVIRSNSVVFATLFYSKDDVYHVGSMKQELLKIKPNLKFRQISNIEEFIDYVDTGMDRSEHPVKDIEMINVYSTWEKVDYKEVVRDMHEPEVRQIDRKDLEALGEAIKDAEVEGIKKTIINIFLGNKETNNTHTLTDKEVYQKVKDEYGWDQAKGVGDISTETAGGYEDHGFKINERQSFPGIDHRSVKIKFLDAALKFSGPIGEGFGTYTTINDISKSGKKFEKQQKVIEQCWNDAKNIKSKHFDGFGRCITLQKETLINFENDLYESTGYGAFSPENIKKVKKLIEKKRSSQ